MLSPTGRPTWRRYRHLVIALAAGLSLSLVAFAVVRQDDRADLRREFEHQAAVLAIRFQEEVQNDLDAVAIVADLFNVLGVVSRRQFRELATPLLSRHPTLLALNWAPRVPYPTRAAFEAAGRVEGFPHFREIFERDARGGTSRAAAREEYFPVYYRESLRDPNNSRFLGLDWGALPARREALQRARDTGVPALTAQAPLTQGGGGVLVYWPVYRGGAPRGTVEERRTHLIGFIAAVYSLQQLVESPLRRTAPRGLEMWVYDQATNPGERFLYRARPPAAAVRASGDTGDERAIRAGLHWSTTIPVGGREWELLFAPTPEFLTAYGSWRAWGILAAGLVLTALGVTGVNIFLLAGRAAEVERLVAVRTHELYRATEHLEQEVGERQQAEGALKRSVVLRDALAGLSAAIAESTDRKDILRRVVSATRQLLGAPYAVLWVLSPAGTDFTVAAEEVDPSLGPLPSQAAFPLAGSFAETIIGEGRPVALPDVRQNPRWQNASWAGLEQLVSYVAVPLVREAGLVGFLAAMDRLGRAFTEEEMEVLQSLGTHAALAVEKAGLLEGARKAAERAQALVDVGKILTATLDLNSVLDLIVDKVVAVTGAGRCGIARLTPAGQLEYIRAKGFDDSVPPVFSRGEGLIGRCLEMGAPVWSRNVLEDPAITLRPEMRAQTQSRGALAVPIVTPQAPYGVLYIGRRQPHDHSPEEIAFAETLASQAAIAIENARLYEESQRRANEAEALAEVGQALSASLEMDKVLDLVVGGVQRVMRVPYVQLLSLDEATQDLTFVRGVGFDPADMARVRLKVGEGITGRAVEQGAPLQTANLLEDPRFLSLGLAEVTGIRSLLAVPLRGGERRLGALVALRQDQHIFTPPEIQLLERFAAQAAIAIQNARLFAEEQKRRRQVEAVRAVTAEIARELDLPIVLELIYRKAVELVGGTSGSVLLWEERSQVLVPQAWIGYGDWMKEVRIKLGEGAAGTAALRREGLIVHDYRNWPDAIPVFADRSGFTTTLAEPLLYGDRLLGVIVVNSEGAGEQFTPQHRETISLFASQAAIAIENARLYAQAREALRQVEALYEAGQAVTESLNLDATLTRIVENARRLAGADRAFLWVAEDGAASLRAGIATGPGAETFVGTRIPAGSGSTAALAFGECRTVTVEDMALSTEFDRGLAARFGNAALVAVPLRLHEAISAVLVCGYNQPRRFESAEVELLTGLGRHAAIALENSHLYAEAERRRREAEEALAQVKRLQGLLPICSYCKKIRDDKNYWQQVEHYVAEHSEAQFSHGICPECYQKVAKPALERLRRSARDR